MFSVIDTDNMPIMSMVVLENNISDHIRQFN